MELGTQAHHTFARAEGSVQTDFYNLYCHFGVMVKQIFGVLDLALGPRPKYCVHLIMMTHCCGFSLL